MLGKWNLISYIYFTLNAVYTELFPILKIYENGLLLDDSYFWINKQRMLFVTVRVHRDSVINSDEDDHHQIPRAGFLRHFTIQM